MIWINCSDNRYNLNGFGGFVPQGLGNGIDPNQFGGSGLYNNPNGGQFGNQLAGNGYFPQYANGGGGVGIGGLGGLGNGLGNYPHNQYQQNGIYPGGVNGCE